MLSRLALILACLAAPALASPPVATQTAGSNVVIDHSGTITMINVTTGATAGFLIVVDSATLPGDGTVKPVMCIPVAAATGIIAPITPDGVTVGSGAAVMFSSGASCFALLKSATAFISVVAR